MKKCLFYSFVTGLIACFLLYIFSPFITVYWLHSKISNLPLKILAFSLPFLALSSCMNGYFSAIRKVKNTVISQVTEELLKILLVSFLLNHFLPSGLEYACISLVLGSTISEFFSFLLLMFLFFNNQKKISSRGYQDTNYTKQILKIALPISLTSYIRSGLSTLKQILIPTNLEKYGLSCKDAISQYGIINGMVMPLIMFPCSFISSFSVLLIPEFSYMNAKKDNYKMSLALNKILKFCFIFSFLIMGFFWCFADNLNKFIYPSSNISVYIKLLSPLILLMYIDNIVDSILKGLDKQVSVMGINILDLVCTIILIFFLLPLKGLSGYIIVLFISELLNGLLSFLLLIKETNIKIDFSNWIFKPFFSILFLNYVFSYFNENVNIYEFIYYSFIFIITYFLLLVLFKGIVKKDIRF